MNNYEKSLEFIQDSLLLLMKYTDDEINNKRLFFTIKKSNLK